MATNSNNPTKDRTFATDKTEDEFHKKTLTPLDPSTPDSDSPSLSQLDPAADDAGGATNGADSKGKEALNAIVAANDIDKKARRAERFGVPLQLSEKEKRNSRAERFGSVPASDGTESSEDLKRKARADRFGLSANGTADEDAKKKARLARFGSNDKVDTQEQEKRKARALRFANSPATANGKQNVELEAAVAGNTAGGT